MRNSLLVFLIFNTSSGVAPKVYKLSEYGT